MDAGVGGVAGPRAARETAGLGYLKGRNFSVVIPASRWKRHGFDSASRW